MGQPGNGVNGGEVTLAACAQSAEASPSRGPLGEAVGAHVSNGGLWLANGAVVGEALLLARHLV